MHYLAWITRKVTLIRRKRALTKYCPAFRCFFYSNETRDKNINTTYSDKKQCCSQPLNTYQYYLILIKNQQCVLLMCVDCVVCYVLLCCYRFLEKNGKNEKN